MECDVPRVSARELVAYRAEQQLQRINDAGLAAQDRVFLLSLAPIKVQIGAKWPSRSKVIWDAVERALAKSMQPPNVCFRLNETSVFVSAASVESYEGLVSDVPRLVHGATFRRVGLQPVFSALIADWATIGPRAAALLATSLQD